MNIKKHLTTQGILHALKSGHGAHEHPLAIREVRRIMLEHAKKNGGKAL